MLGNAAQLTDCLAQDQVYEILRAPRLRYHLSQHARASRRHLLQQGEKLVIEALRDFLSLLAFDARSQTVSSLAACVTRKHNICTHS
jgi:hypothetical protein